MINTTPIDLDTKILILNKIYEILLLNIKEIILDSKEPKEIEEQLFSNYDITFTELISSSVNEEILVSEESKQFILQEIDTLFNRFLVDVRYETFEVNKIAESILKNYKIGFYAGEIEFDNSIPVTYNISSSPSNNVKEGESLTIQVITTGINNGTQLPYEITGVQSNDLAVGSLVGNVSINNNSGSVTLQLAGDTSAETETLTFVLLPGTPDETSINVNILDVAFILSTNSVTNTFNEGELVTINLTTQNIVNGTQIPYTITTTLNQNDLDSGSISNGIFEILDNQSSISFVLKEDFTTENTEELTLTLGSPANGETITIQITDSSTSPTYELISNSPTNQFDETDNSNVIITLNTTNVPSGTTVPYTITGTLLSSDLSIGSINNGNFTVINNKATLSFNIKADAVNDGDKTLTLALGGGLTESITINISDTSPEPPEYSLVTNKSSGVYEGQSITFTIQDVINIPDGTVFNYTITGINSADLAAGSDPLTGTKTLTSQTATITLNLAIDSDSGENITVQTVTTIDPGSGPVTLTRQLIVPVLEPTFGLESSSTTVNEGQTVTFTLYTQGILDGTVIPYIVTGIDSSDLTSGNINGNFTINNEVDSVSFTLAEDFKTEGYETLKLTLGSPAPAIFKNVKIVDLSTFTVSKVLTASSSSVNEGGEVTFTLNTGGIASADIDYTVTGIDANDLDPNSPNGITGILSLVGDVNGPGAGSITFKLKEDSFTEDVETLTVTLGEPINLSKSVTINDTSVGIFGIYQAPPITSNLSLHLSPSQQSFFDINGNEVGSEDSLINTWTDKINNQNFIVPSSSTTKPTLKVLPGNMPIVQFDGQTAWLKQNQTIVDYQKLVPRTIFIVSKYNGTSANRDGIFGSRGSGLYDHGQFMTYENNNTLFYSNAGVSGSTARASIVASNFNVISLETQSPGGIVLQVNKETPVINTKTPSFNNSTSYILANEGGNLRNTGEIQVGEVLAYDSILSPTDKIAVIDWLMNKWNIL